MKHYLDNYIETLPANGRYHFTREDLHTRFGYNDIAIRHGLRRLTHHKQIQLIRNGFYIIIPPDFLTDIPNLLRPEIKFNPKNLDLNFLQPNESSP